MLSKLFRKLTKKQDQSLNLDQERKAQEQLERWIQQLDLDVGGKKWKI